MIKWTKIEDGCELPNYYDHVLLTVKNVFTGEISDEFGYRVECYSVFTLITNNKNCFFKIPWNSSNIFYRNHEVIAWAPWPEPYKEEEQS